MELKQKNIVVYLKKIIPYFILFGVCFLLLFPFMTGFTLHGHDLFYHLQAVKSLDIAYKNGTFFSRIYELTCQNYGYATGLFYSMIPSSIAVLIKNWFNISTTLAIGIELTFILFFATVIVYKFLIKINVKKNYCLIIAILYIIFPYYISNIYIRFAFTETFLILLVPMIAISFYELIEEKNYFKFFIYFVIGYSLSIMIHLALTIYVTIFALIYLVINYREFFKKKTLILFASACVFVLLISSTFYIPMLIAQSDINLGNMSFSKLWDSTIAPFRDLYLDGAIGNFFLTVSLFVILIIYIVYLILFIINRKNNTRNQKIVFILSTVLLFTISPLNILWFIIDYTFLNLIQFSWRLYLFYAFFTVLQLVYILSKSKKILFNYFIGWYVVVFLTAFLIYTVTFVNGVASDFDNNVNMISTNYGSGSKKHGDYYPKGATKDYVFHRGDEMILDTNLSIIEFANYQSIKQINFYIITPAEDSFIVLKLPYSNCNNIKAYQYDECYPFNKYELGLNKQEIEGEEYLKLEFNECENNSKITIDYSNSDDLDTYLKENPFEFIVRGGDYNANFTNFIKENSHKYSVDINTNRATQIELPTLYYKGYKVYYKTANGVTRLNEYRNENGFIEVEVSESGTLYIEFKAGYVTVSNIISIIGVISFIIFTVLLYEYEKRLKISKINNSEEETSEKIEKDKNDNAKLDESLKEEILSETISSKEKDEKFSKIEEI